jgi:hypothetical protein
MVTTVRKGRPNIMTLVWHTMIGFDPPLAGLRDQQPKLPGPLKAKKSKGI